MTGERLTFESQHVRLLVSKQPHTIRLSHCEFRGYSARLVIGAAQLSILHLTHCGITSVGAAHIAVLIAMAPGLIDLDLSFNDLGPTGGEYLGAALGQSGGRNIDTTSSSNSSSKSSSDSISDGISRCNLRRLALSRCGLGRVGLRAIGAVLGSDNGIVPMNTGTDTAIAAADVADVGEIAVAAAAAPFKNNAATCGIQQTLAVLRVDDNQPEIDDPFDPLDHNPQHSVLQPWRNGFDDLAQSLVGNTVLSVLDISGTNMGLRGVRALAAALGYHPQLTELRCQENNIGSAGALHIATIIQKCKALVHVDVGSNNITYSGVAALATAVIGRTLALNLFLMDNCAGDRGTIALAAAMLDTSNIVWPLQKLNLDFNGITERGAAAIAEVLAHPDCNLQHLSLRDCPLGVVGITALTTSLVHNTRLMHLDLARCNLLGGDDIFLGSVESARGRIVLEYEPSRVVRIAQQHSSSGRQGIGFLHAVRRFFNLYR